jgi:polysaccharide export outer membrane protein
MNGPNTTMFSLDSCPIWFRAFASLDGEDPRIHTKSHELRTLLLRVFSWIIRAGKGLFQNRTLLSLRVLSLITIVIAPIAVHAQVNQNTPPQTTQISSSIPAAQTQRYRIGAGDVLDIRILNRPQLSREAVRVEGDGMIRMPLIEGEIQAACKSEGELASEIAKRYLKYYRNPQVDVFVKEYHAREVALIGAVNEQGRYQMQRRLRLLELLSFAKGPSDKAGQTINIVRGPRTDICGNNGESTSDEGGFISLRLNDTLRGEERANPYVQAGDIVTIPEAEQVYVVGNVYGPRALSLKEPISVSRAIAMAGGPLRDSKTDRIHIVRQQANGEKSEMYVNLSAIARKRAEDVLLQPNDIVEVPESTGKSVIRSLLGAVAPSVAQLPVRVIP